MKITYKRTNAKSDGKIHPETKCACCREYRHDVWCQKFCALAAKAKVKPAVNPVTQPLPTVTENRVALRIECVETGAVFANAWVLQRMTGIPRTNVYRALKSGQQAYMLTWRYTDAPISKDNALIIETKRLAKRVDTRRKMTYCHQTNEYYYSVAAAAKALKLSSSAIASVCRGESEQVRGYTFEYREEAE